MDNLVLIIGLLVAIGSIIGAMYLFFRPLQQGLVRLDLKVDSFRTELKGDIDDLRTELKADIAELRTELKAEIKGVDAKYDFKTDEIRRDILQLSRDVTALATALSHAPNRSLVAV
jgi:hypothetical protein